ncbi:MAG: D-aminoacyl-tRNA deacylase [Melioribacter sp.]|uniref:D-aminoacyl-tRNA deacylase n=1 Tax=Rosettibacter primus TaxID=3111523 RepID=UPI00247DD25F|nr:D-aminoacyl-tRNA deacylase [Melioribacter sp.]
MRALIQRVTEGSVEIREANYSASIGKGMVILLGVKEGDTEEDMIFVADKCSNLRIFEDENGKMNLSLKDIDGEVLIISQFTLYGDARRGNRPSFTDAAKPELAEELYNKFVNRMKNNLGEDKVKTGIFAAMMLVKIFNDGPVTILVESK